MKNDVNVASKSNKHKIIFFNISFVVFVGALKINDEKSRIRIRIRIHQLEAWIRGSGSTPKCHGSGTLEKIIPDQQLFKLGAWMRNLGCGSGYWEELNVNWIRITGKKSQKMSFSEMGDKSLDTALDLKLKGNDHFKKSEFKEAIDLYAAAIDACPPHR